MKTLTCILLIFLRVFKKIKSTYDIELDLG